MQVLTKKIALITGLSLGLMALPVAHGDGEGMTVLMNSNFVTADPENIKWAPNKSTPYGMQIVLLFGDPSQPGPYIFRANEVIIQEMGTGFEAPARGIEYVNPDDDPRNNQ